MEHWSVGVHSCSIVCIQKSTGGKQTCGVRGFHNFFFPKRTKFTPVMYYWPHPLCTSTVATKSLILRRQQQKETPSGKWFNKELQPIQLYSQMVLPGNRLAKLHYEHHLPPFCCIHYESLPGAMIEFQLVWYFSNLYATLVEYAWVFPLWSLVVSYHKGAKPWNLEW